MVRIWTEIIGFAAICCLLVIECVGQKTLTMKNDAPAAIQVDQFRRISAEDKSARFDSLFHELNNNPGSFGYVFIFCGKVCQYGEVEAHIRGIEIKAHFRAFDRSRLILLNAGYRREFEVELWRVPPGSTIPIPKSEMSIKDVTFSGTRKNSIEPYDCCEDPVWMWNEFKKKSKSAN